MQIEEQIQSADMPAIAPCAQSDKSKSKRGGKRPGAGRKPNLAKRLASVLKPMTAAEILQQVDVPGVFSDIFKKRQQAAQIASCKRLVGSRIRQAKAGCQRVWRIGACAYARSILGFTAKGSSRSAFTVLR